MGNIEVSVIPINSQMQNQGEKNRAIFDSCDFNIFFKGRKFVLYKKYVHIFRIREVEDGAVCAWLFSHICVR